MHTRNAQPDANQQKEACMASVVFTTQELPLQCSAVQLAGVATAVQQLRNRRGVPECGCRVLGPPGAALPQQDLAAAAATKSGARERHLQVHRQPNSQTPLHGMALSHIQWLLALYA